MTVEWTERLPVIYVWIEGLPVIYAKAKRVKGDGSLKGYWRLIVQKCPYCGKEHTHSGGSKDVPSEYGGRVAHCLNGKSYVLVPEDDE